VRRVYGEDDTLRRMERASAPDVQIEPLDDWLTVSPASDEHETRTGLIIPSAGEVPVISGIVLAIGDEVQGVAPGDKVLFPRAAGMEVRLGGEPVLIVRRRDVVARVGE
jgi:co-chaperonin GroES (HSP10)